MITVEGNTGMDAVWFDFSALPRPRSTYERTLANYLEGLLSVGFMWELAKHDQVFAAFLRRNRVEKLTAAES